MYVQKRFHKHLTEKICDKTNIQGKNNLKPPKRNIIEILRFPNQVLEINRFLKDHEVTSILKEYKFFWIYSYISLFLFIFIMLPVFFV